MERKRNFQNLDLSNAFLFAAAMSDPITCSLVLELILDRTMGTVMVQSEKSILYSSDFRSARLDVYISENVRVDYDLEMENRITDKNNLPKRSRFYQAQMDVEALKPGEDFSSLKPSYVIFICTFDPFGQNLYRYTYENICLETGAPLGDGTRKIYLNTKGKNSGEVPEGLVSFLRYVENSTDECAQECGNSVIDVIHGRVKALKHSRDWEAKFMTFEEWVKAEKQESCKFGEEKILKLVRVLLQDNRLEELSQISEDTALRERLCKEYKLSDIV